jgi:ribonucleoside-diphosphate reductase alpha chain
MKDILPSDYQNFIALSRYARWLPEKNRRETWKETVARYFDFMEEHLKENTNYELTSNTKLVFSFKCSSMKSK